MGKRELNFERFDKITAIADATLVAGDKIAVYDVSAGNVLTATLTQLAAILDTAIVSDVIYGEATWNAVTEIAPSKNAVRDKFVLIDAAVLAAVSDTAYDDTSWNGVTLIAPSKNAVRDKVATIDTAIALRTSVVQVSASIAEINAEKILIAGTAAKKIVVTNISAIVTGNFADVTSVEVEDETGNDVISYAVAALTDGVLVIPSSANVTPAAAGFGVALTAGEDLVVSKTGAVITGGTSMAFTISYVLVD